MGGPTYYENHASEHYTVEEAIQDIYGKIMIRKAIALCPDEHSCEELYLSLRMFNYPVSMIIESDFEKGLLSRSLRAFLDDPNHILIISYNSIQKLSEEDFHAFILGSNHNLLISNDVPSYRVDTIMTKILAGHKRGFWENNVHDDTYHVLWHKS